MNISVLLDIAEKIKTAAAANKTGLESVLTTLSGAGGPAINYVETFLSSGTWVRPAGVTSIWVLIAAAGGSGYTGQGSSYGGAGGGGGQVILRPMLVSENQAVVVGTGAIQGNGGNSSFGGVIALGGTKATGYNNDSANKGVGGGKGATQGQWAVPGGDGGCNSTLAAEPCPGFGSASALGSSSSGSPGGGGYGKGGPTPGYGGGGVGAAAGISAYYAGGDGIVQVFWTI